MGATIGNIEKGLFIYADTSSALVEKKYIQYKKEDLSIYKDKFYDLVGEGIFMNDCLFEDHKWIGYGNYHYETFDFSEIEYNQYVYLPLKCFVITQLYDRRITVDSAQSRFSGILKMINMTSAYDKQFLNEFIEIVEHHNSGVNVTLSDVKTSNLSFIYFNPIKDSKSYVDTLLIIKDSTNEDNVREIPTYSNFILFDEKIHDFMRNTTSYLREKYYPIFIWWKLTAVIPIRPIEFLEILNEGICYKPTEDSYYISIPRRKQKPDPFNKTKRIAIQQELKISREMYNIIRDFRTLANIKNEKYLFPISAYTKFITKRGQILSEKTLHYTEHMNWGQMTTLLDTFFDDIIGTQYNIEVVLTREELDKENEIRTIKRFNLGDTRHMSICMMMMQGFSELTIAQMAGHTNIVTQAHYSSHIDDFERSYSGLLKKNILQKMNTSYDLNNDINFRQRQLLSYSEEDNSKARKIDFGYCHSNNFPYECYCKDCVFCNKFSIDLSKIPKGKLKDLQDKITIIQDEIQIKLDFIKKYYSRAFTKKADAINTNESDMKELTRNAKNLEILINRKAMLEAHLLKNKEV